MLESAPDTGREPHEPSIRTMQSDVAEFLQRERPSLISLAAKEAAAKNARREIARPRFAPKRIALFLGIGFFILGLAGFGIWLTRPLQPQPAAPSAGTAVPPPAIPVEGMSEATIGNTLGELRRVFSDAAIPPPGTFRGIVIRLRSEPALPAGEARKNPPPITLGELFRLIGARPPSGLTEAASGAPQFFLYGSVAGKRLVIIFETKSAARAISALHSWEATLTQDLAPLFGEPPAANAAPWQDAAYRNIDYRYMPFDADGVSGVGYLHFAGQRRIVMATSAEAITKTIDRLFGNR